MIELYNWEGIAQPNIFHFQGQSRYHYSPLFDEIAQANITNDPRIKILTVATDEEMSPLIKQLQRCSVPYINLWPNPFYCSWSNLQKIDLILKQLNTMDDDDVVLMLDGYDTAIRSLDDLYDKFMAVGYKLLFNSTKHNYPNVNIDRYWKRDFVGDFRYFNAGVVIGHVYAMKNFYSECQKYADIPNPWNSEQYIVRHAWSNYSEDENRIVDFDHHCRLFQTMGSTDLKKMEENKYRVV